MDLSILNERQKEAVLSENKRILVLAGAGSGKTKTLIQKILYLIEEKEVKASSILAITFTKNAANEMLDRIIIAADASGEYEKIINNKKINAIVKAEKRELFKKENKLAQQLTIRTIHSLCYKILRSDGAKIFDNKFKLLTDDRAFGDSLFGDRIADEKPKEIFHKLLIELCKDSAYLLKFKRYIIDYYIDKIDIRKGKNNNYEQDLKYTTLNREKVRSKSERDIADWLYRHNISYQYEPALAVKNFPYNPDFFITQANLYLEHISDLSHDMKHKLEEYRKGGLVVEFIYEEDMKDSALLNLALEQKVYKRLSENHLTNPVLNYQEEFKYYMDKVDEFIRDTLRVNSLIKSNNASLDDIASKGKKNKHERVKVFYELVIPLMKDFEEYCTYKSYLDFDDLIIRTIKLLETHPDIREKYQRALKHILVDEFQDVNNLQVQLIKLLISESTNLFCVGDDWQSIYGFRGSEVDYIVNFPKYFENSKTITLDINYRSTDHIVNASNNVIRHNKFQIQKNIYAPKKSLDKVQIYKANDIEADGVQFVVERVKEYLTLGYRPEDLLVLYRRSKMFHPYFEAFKHEEIKVSHKTIHSAKGLEAKIVFIIGLTEGSGGFPDIWLSDMILSVVKDAPYDMLLEEERRLFYVAMTRAQEELFLITEKGKESSFIDEVPREFSNFSQITYSRSAKSVPVCANCSKEIKDTYKFCPECGAPV